MPQKKNPDLLELVRGKAARVMGCSTTLRTLVKGLPLAYNKDMQETQEALFDASDTMIALLPLVTGFMNTVEFKEAEMNRSASTGFMNAWAARHIWSSAACLRAWRTKRSARPSHWLSSANTIYRNFRSPICRESIRVSTRASIRASDSQKCLRS